MEIPDWVYWRLVEYIEIIFGGRIDMYGDLRRGWVLDLGGCGTLTFLIPFAYPSYLGRSP
jgi:hypothetical protein